MDVPQETLANCITAEAEIHADAQTITYRKNTLIKTALMQV